MKVIFLDFDGVLNSEQSATFWRNQRDQNKWKHDLKERQGSLFEYIAREFCPIALSNMQELMRNCPGTKVVVSSSWRVNNDVDALKKVLASAKLVADAIIDVTPRFPGKPRGEEIKAWLDNHPEVKQYVIIDDSQDMLEEQKDNFVYTSSLHGFQYRDMLIAEGILNR